MKMPLRDVKTEGLQGNTGKPSKQGILGHVMTSTNMSATYSPLQSVPVINLGGFAANWHRYSFSSFVVGTFAPSSHTTIKINKCIALYIRRMYYELHLTTTTGNQIMNIQAIREAFDEITFVKDAYDGLERLVKDDYTLCLIHTIGNQFEARIAVLDQAIIEAELSGLDVETKEAANDE